MIILYILKMIYMKPNTDGFNNILGQGIYVEWSIHLNNS
jgi:hypothetical protein